MRTALVAALALVPAAAFAAGFTFPDLGARQLGRGGTGTATGGEVGALYYNPGALIGDDGWHVQLDAMVSREQVGFQRVNAKGSPGGYGAVANSGGAFADTLSGISYTNTRVALPFALAFGIYGPSSTGNLEYPDPALVPTPSSQDACDHACHVDHDAPQRYSLISENLVVVFPTLALSVRPLSWLDVGAAYSVRYSHIENTLAIYGGPLAGLGSDFDARAVIKATDGGWRLVLGALARPIPGLSIGLSGHLKEGTSGAGTLDITLPPIAAQVHQSVRGDSISLAYTYDPEVRAAARYAWSDFSLELDGVYEGWSAMDSIYLITHDVNIVTKNGDTETVKPVQSIPLKKNWHDAYSGRLGFEWQPRQGALTVRAGALAETSAVPTSTLSVDFPAWERAGGTLGAEYRFANGMSVVVAYEHLASPDTKVRDSQVKQATADPSVTPDVVGNGNYTASLDYFSAGFGFSFGGTK